MERIEFEYNVASVVIDFYELGKRPRIQITPEDLDEMIGRELWPIIDFHIKRYAETGKVPPWEEAREHSAHKCIPGKIFQEQIDQEDIADLVKGAGVTERFAIYRVSLDKKGFNGKTNNYL